LKRFICANVIPGCAAVISGAGDQSVLDQVLKHAASDHGLVRPQLPFIELVMTHTRPFTPTHQRQRLRLVGPTDAGRRVDTTNGQETDGRSTRAAAGDGGRGGRPRPLTTSNGHSNVHPIRPLAPSRAVGANQTYRHECLLYAGCGGFLNAVVPFVRDALAHHEPVMVAVAEPRLQALRSALGQDATEVVFADMATIGRNPALIIPAWRQFADRHRGPVRGVGEPIWATRRPEEIAEAQLHEALLNVAVPSEVPLWLLCPYDSAALDPQVLAEAHRSHPAGPNPDRSGGGDRPGSVMVEQLLGAGLPDPDGPTTSITFDPARHGHVERILWSADRAGLPADRAVKLAAAVDEIALAVAGETGPVGIRLWHHRTAVVCEVTDPGRVSDPLIGRGPGIDGRTPRDRAVRLANELCDLVQLRSGSAGTTVRIHSWR
jgi:predicted small metal-binding protein